MYTLRKRAPQGKQWMIPHCSNKRAKPALWKTGTECANPGCWSGSDGADGGRRDNYVFRFTSSSSRSRSRGKSGKQGRNRRGVVVPRGAGFRKPGRPESKKRKGRDGRRRGRQNLHGFNTQLALWCGNGQRRVERRSGSSGDAGSRGRRNPPRAGYPKRAQRSEAARKNRHVED